jgi:hypothetical protein
MGKALSIKDTETYELVSQIAAKTGLSMTQSVKKAAKAQLELLEAERVASIEAWIARVEANPLTADCWVELEDQPMQEPVAF